jgi:predicted Zn finger-like uncharacterized protein
MSLITSCPACGTMFRVVPDQLKISEGWVRCGHCSEVFDASAYLSDESVLDTLRTAEAALPPPDAPQVPAYLAASPPEPPPPPARPPAPEPGPQPEPMAWFGETRDAGRHEVEESSLPPSDFPGGTQPATLPVDLASRPDTQYGAAPDGAAAVAATAAAAREADDSSFFGTEDESLEPSPLDGPFVFRRSDLVDHDHDEPALPPAPRDDQLRAADHDGLAHDEHHDVSFVRQARRRAFWRRPLVRAVLLLAGLALAALLALQVGYHDRDRLALERPQLRPALEGLCGVLGCSIGPPRQIESIVIDSSGFVRVRNDTYRLAFTLRNTARVQVAVPAMELTITDAQDQPIARRVLMAAELGAPGQALAPAAEWSGAVGVVVSPSGTARVAGYRLLAFYP